MRKLLKNIAAFIKSNISKQDVLQDIFVFGGLALAGYGIAQLNVPAAWIAIGTVIFMLGLRR